MYLCIVFLCPFYSNFTVLKETYESVQKATKNVNSSLYIEALDQLIICIARHIIFGIPSKDIQFPLEKTAYTYQVETSLEACQNKPCGMSLQR